MASGIKLTDNAIIVEGNAGIGTGSPVRRRQHRDQPLLTWVIAQKVR